MVLRADIGAILATAQAPSSGGGQPPTPPPSNEVDGILYWLLDEAASPLAAKGGVNFSDLVETSGLSTITYQQPSLRSDGAGNSVNFAADSQGSKGGYISSKDTIDGLPSGSAFDIDWGFGFTMEGLFRTTQTTVDGITAKGKFAAGVSMQGDVTGQRHFIMQADNYAALTDTNGLHSALHIYNRVNGTADFVDRDSYNDPALHLGTLFDAESYRLGEVYHWLASFRPSSDTVEFWVNGVSRGVYRLPVSRGWFTANGSLLYDARIRDCYFDLGENRKNDFSRGHIGDACNVKIHSIEATDDFAKAQYQGATGNVVDKVIGVFRAERIGVQTNDNGRLGTTRIDAETVRRLGTEQANVGRVKAYTDNAIWGGESRYIEFEVVDFAGAGDLAWWIGLEVAQIETTNNDTGFGNNEFGFSRHGWVYADNANLTTSQGVIYTVGDIIGLSVEHMGTSVTCTIFKNNVETFKHTYLTSTTRFGLRPAVTMGSTSTSTNAEVKIYTTSENQTYDAPAGYLPLDETYLLDGDFFWPMDDESILYFKGTNFKHTEIDTAIALPIGSRVRFELYSMSNTTANQPFISSTDGSTFGVRAGGTSNSISFTGCNVSVNGVGVSDGELGVFVDNGKYIIEAVLTVASDFKFILHDGSGYNTSSLIGVNKITVDDTSTELFFEYAGNNVVSSPEVNFGVRSLEVIANTATTWREGVDVMRCVNRGMAHMQLGAAGSSNATPEPVKVASLRADGAGTAIRYNSNDYHSNIRNYSYANGFTIEFLVKPDVISNRGTADGGLVCGVQVANNSFVNTLWVCRFDNWHDPAQLNVVYPVFTLPARDATYSQASISHPNIVAEVRSSTPAVLGQTYHFMATIRPSTDEIEFWVDGVSIGTAAIDPTWYDSNGGAGDNILNGERATILNVGSAFHDGTWRASDATIQGLRISLREADQAYVDERYADVSTP